MKKEKKEVKKSNSVLKNVIGLVLILVISYFIYFFINDFYTNMFFSLLISIISFIFFYYFWKKGVFNFIIFSLLGISMFVSLEVSFNLNLIYNFIIALFFACVFGLLYLKYNSRKNYALLLLYSFLILFIILAFNVHYRDDWFLENYLNIPFVILLVIMSKWFKFSRISYTLIFLFMFMNVIGSHYTYAEVPFGDWLKNFFDLDRNHYDRIVHFLFGLLFAYPVREVFIRIGKYKGFWALFAPIMLVSGLSSIYELLEWGIAVIYGGDLGIAYLGSQGDVWDAQKDMFLAGMGSIITTFVVFLVNTSYRGKEFFNELRESFRIDENDLGEVAIERMKNKN